MRDFRDAKAMARTMRAALAAKGIKITVGQSLELVAEAFGVADWNTLSASILAAVASSREAGLAAPRPAEAAATGSQRLRPDRDYSCSGALLLPARASYSDNRAQPGRSASL